MPPERDGERGGLCRTERGRERGTVLPSVCDRLKLIPPPLFTRTHSFLQTHVLSHTGVHTRTSQPHRSRWRREEVWAALGSIQQGRCSRDWQTDRDYYNPSLPLSLWNIWISYPSSEIKIYIVLGMGYYMWLSIIQKRYHPALITHFSVLSVHLAECDKLRKDGFRSSQYYSQGPTFSDPAQSTSSLQDDEDDDIDKKVHIHINTARKNTHIAVQLTTIEFNGVSLPSSGQTRKCILTWVSSLSPFLTWLFFFFFLTLHKYDYHLTQ